MVRHSDVPEPHVIDELEKLKREEFEQRPFLEVPAPELLPKKEEKKSDRGVIHIQII